VLIVVPPSESKNPPPRRGKPVDLERLSFPRLTALRARVLDALVTTSARTDALARLDVGASLCDEVERNTRLRRLPARPALEVYNGVLYDALDASSLSPAAKRRAASRVVIVSGLWGAVRPTDRIPAYRCTICATLVGVDALEPAWRAVLRIRMRRCCLPISSFPRRAKRSLKPATGCPRAPRSTARSIDSTIA